MKKTNKRGELTTQQLVTIIILIISFVVILFLIFRLNLGETTDKEICHNSFVMKAKAKNLAGELDCRTEYLCIVKDGDCQGINPSREIKVDNKEEIIEAIENEINDCWWMIGECELDYGGFWDTGGYHCAICSIIKFGDGIQKQYAEIEINGKSILTSGKYAIFTGMNPGLGEDPCIRAQIINSEDVGDEAKSGCEVFDITKA
jgi:hypothetical protein